MLSLLFIAGATVVVLGLVVKSIVNEGPDLVASVTNTIQELEDWLQKGPLQLSDADLNSAISQAEEWGKSLGVTLLGDLGGAASSLGTLITAGSVFLFAVIFFMIKPAQVWGFLLTWIPRGGRETVDVSGRLAWDSISGYTRGIVVVALADAFLVFVGLVILQVPMAAALAAVVFLGAFIPVIGAPVATFFAAVVALAERGPLVAVLVIALTIVVGSFDGDVMQPLVMGKAVNLHPLAIVILIAGGALGFGIIGALVAVPLGSAVYSVIKYLSGRDPVNPRPGAWDAPPRGPRRRRSRSRIPPCPAARTGCSTAAAVMSRQPLRSTHRPPDPTTTPADCAICRAMAGQVAHPSARTSRWASRSPGRVPSRCLRRTPWPAPPDAAPWRSRTRSRWSSRCT